MQQLNGEAEVFRSAASDTQPLCSRTAGGHRLMSSSRRPPHLQMASAESGEAGPSCHNPSSEVCHEHRNDSILRLQHLQLHHLHLRHGNARGPQRLGDELLVRRFVCLHVVLVRRCRGLSVTAARCGCSCTGEMWRAPRGRATSRFRHPYIVICEPQRRRVISRRGAAAPYGIPPEQRHRRHSPHFASRYSAIPSITRSNPQSKLSSIVRGLPCFVGNGDSAVIPPEPDVRMPESSG